MPAASFPLDKNEVEARLLNGKVALRFPLALDEDVYGLGVDFRAMRRTGSAFQLHVDHWGGRTGRTHAPVPFYVSTKGYGVFIDSARYVNFNVGIGVRLAAPEKPPVIDRTTGRAEVVVDAALRFGRGAGARAGRRGLRLRRPHGAGRRPPLQPVERRRRAPAEVGAGLHDPHAHRRTARSDALDEVAEFRRRGIPLDMLGLEPGWHDHAYPCSFEWDKTRFPDPAGLPGRAAASSTCAPTSGSTRTSRPPRRCTRSCCRTPARTWSGTASCPTTRSPRRAAIFADHLREKVVGLDPAALGGFKVDEVDGYDHWLWPDLARLPVRPRRRAAPPDLRPARAAAAHRPLPRAEPPHARPGARHQRRRLVVPVRHLQRQLRLRRVHHRGRQQRVRGRAVVARGARRRGRGHAAPHAGGLLLAAGALQRLGDRDQALDARRRWPTTSATPSSCACACCPTGTPRSRSTTSRARRWCAPCRCWPASQARAAPGGGTARRAPRTPTPSRAWWR